MDGKYLVGLRDCCIELNMIKSWINNNKFDSKNRYLINYAVVKASGTIEREMKSLIFDRVSRGANAETITYFSKRIVEAPYNPSPGKIEKILSDFNSAWSTSFSQVINSTKQKSDLKSLVELRNSFAHGNSITASIDTIIQYYISGMWILNQLSKIIT